MSSSNRGESGGLIELIGGILAGILLGAIAAAILEAIYSPKCPACKKPVKRGSPYCPHCKVALKWD